MFCLSCNIANYEEGFKLKKIPKQTVVKKYLQSIVGLLLLRKVLNDNDLLQKAASDEGFFFTDAIGTNDIGNKSWYSEVELSALFQEEDLEHLQSFFSSMSDENYETGSSKTGNSVLQIAYEELKKNLFADFVLDQKEKGKPYIVRWQSSFAAAEYLQEGRFHFNISHSGDFVVLAFDTEAEIGVDIEDQKRSSNPLSLAKRFFSEKELQYLEKMEQNRLQSEFIRIWCRKEAYGKMMGVGLGEKVLQRNLLEYERNAYSFYEKLVNEHYWLVVCRAI